MNKSKAFTLIEMLVAVTIFTLVIGSATGLFIAAVRSQARALAAQKLLDETSYTIEYMSRALRMARKETKAPNGCLSQNGLNYENPSGDDSIRFINMYNICQEFRLDEDFLKERKSTDETANNLPLVQDALPLTSDDFEVSSLNFNLSGQQEPPADNLQPRITISMTIGKKPNLKPQIKIQTTISQRNLDL